MTKRFLKIVDNEYATIFTGPGNQKLETGRQYTEWINKVGNFRTHWDNGAMTQVTTGPSFEVCNSEPEAPKTSEDVGKLIHCKNGDMVLITEGNFKVRAKNIILEASDTAPGGNVDIIGNGLVTIKTDETLRIAAGEVQITGEKHIVVDAQGFLYLIGDIKNSGHPTVVGTISAFVNGNWASVLSSVSTTLRGG